MMELAEHVLKNIVYQYTKLKNQAETALNQAGEDYFFNILGDESNSLAILTKHIAGNMRSRWTDFLTTDGEKEFRNRPSEFVQNSEDTFEGYIDIWDKSWKILYETLDNLAPSDLLKTVTIRGEEHTVVEALHRQLTHYAAHIGQIVLLAKHWKGEEWNTLSIPKDAVKLYDGKYKKE